jgi:hypothetical protein
VQPCAAAGAAGTDAAGKEFLIAVRIKAGARNFIKKTADEAGLRSLPGRVGTFHRVILKVKTSTDDSQYHRQVLCSFWRGAKGSVKR